MKISGTSVAGLLFFLSMFVNMTRQTGAASQTPASPTELLNGERIYATNCAVCHGQNGDGRGMAAHMLVAQPRDFRPGSFKFRSTPSGALPTDDDLLKIVTEGIRWTAMVGRGDLSASERQAVVQYVKTFSPRFANDRLPPLITVALEPLPSPDLIAQGRQLYGDADCAKCHGERGDGRGIDKAELVDEAGWPLPASDLTWRPLKRGSLPRETYLTVATGLNGTSMPAFAAALDGQQIWSLVYYLESLVPSTHGVSPGAMLGEEQRGWMILRMQGMMGHGTMSR